MPALLIVLTFMGLMNSAKSFKACRLIVSGEPIFHLLKFIELL
jgi:hypothetical protein